MCSHHQDLWKTLHPTSPIHRYISLPTHSPHNGTVSSTSQHAKPKPWTPWTSQPPREVIPATFPNLHPPFPYSQPTPPPPPTRITLAPALQHTQLDRHLHLKPLAGRPPQASSRPSTLTPGGYFAGRSIKSLTPNRLAMFLHQEFDVSPLNSGRLLTSSVLISSGSHRFPTTYSAPPPPPPPHTLGVPPSSAGTEAEEHSRPPFDVQTTPQTPAHPTFPPKSTIPPSPMSLGPIASQTQANIGPSIKIRRDRDAAGERLHISGPYVPSAFD